MSDDVCVVVFTDGRDRLLERTLASFEEQVDGPISRIVIHDDSGDHRHASQLRGRYPHEVIGGGRRRGFGGAIGLVWAYLARSAAERFVFHMEDDFTFNAPLDLAEMAAVLDAEPDVAQMALRRQPWNDQERAAGGVVETRPNTYTDRHTDGWPWLSHRNFFTTNPSLYRTSLCLRGWPDGGGSEGRFSIGLFADHPEVVCGFWGDRDSAPWVHHIGATRVGVGY